MVTVQVLASLVALFGLFLPNLLHPMQPRPVPEPQGLAPEAPRPVAVPPPAAEPPGHPESMTAELDPGDEEYLAFVADELWPDDEYLELEHTSDGEEESGGSSMLR
ncbi:hypothetical protein [Actinomadura sp. WMMA1423]|uniref:hypothetical protein n=1 Tax=Actinomadura sp. WMMA1423 TaxID=2591108 RepID=UPI0011464FC8|nr:hypothetical protein [Actinomadura sp. WMMA1423]